MQFVTTYAQQVIVGMAVVSAGSDMAQLLPMVEQVERYLGQSPEARLIDGGVPAHEQIEALTDKTEVYAPVPAPRKKRNEQRGDACQTSISPNRMNWQR